MTLTALGLELSSKRPLCPGSDKGSRHGWQDTVGEGELSQGGTRDRTGMGLRGQGGAASGLGISKETRTGVSG